VGISSTKSLEISLFVVERTLFRNQLSDATFDGDVDKGIAFLLKSVTRCDFSLRTLLPYYPRLDISSLAMKDELEHNFTLFPTLPHELRNQIRAHAASTLRPYTSST
jgi:hypothetical protein